MNQGQNLVPIIEGELFLKSVFVCAMETIFFINNVK